MSLWNDLEEEQIQIEEELGELEGREEDIRDDLDKLAPDSTQAEALRDEHSELKDRVQHLYDRQQEISDLLFKLDVEGVMEELIEEAGGDVDSVLIPDG